MLKIFFVLSLLSTITSVQDQNDHINMILNSLENKSAIDVFKVWHSLFKKTYSLNSQEAKSRFLIFEDNIKFIRENNEKNNGFTLGLNQFSDLTNDEFKKIYLDTSLGKKVERMISTESEFEVKQFLNDQTSGPTNYTAFNFSEYFPPTRNQGRCGSCWAFSTVGAIEAGWSMRSNQTMYLSPQQLIDCDFLNVGCTGGNPDLSYKYIIRNGISSEERYPYKAVKQRCATQNVSRDVNITNMKSCNAASCVLNDTFYNLLREGPLSVLVDAGTREFQLYKSGVLPTATCGQINHAIIALGFDYEYRDDKVTPYWIIRNSWGNTWGQQGNAFIAYTPFNTASGSCFIDKFGWLPIF
jgi:C1A family cysteine protease